MMHLRLKAAACAGWVLRRVPRQEVVPLARRRPLVADAVGVEPLLAGVLARVGASLLNIGGRAALLRLEAAAVR